MKTIFALLTLFASTAMASETYFDWSRGQDGFGYCYEWTADGKVLNGGQPVPERFCEEKNPSFFSWARSQSGWGNCYRFTPQGVVMDFGQPKPYRLCEKESPSYFRWLYATNGYYYCYQLGAGYVLNEGRPVPNQFCY